MLGTTFEQLPFDGDGILQGVYRLVHADPSFGGTLGLVQFKGGVSTTPVAGRPLRMLIGEYGGHLYLEPWGELPRGYMLPECVKAMPPAPLLARLPVAPWRKPKQEADAPIDALEAGPDRVDPPTMPQPMPPRRRR